MYGICKMFWRIQHLNVQSPTVYYWKYRNISHSDMRYAIEIKVIINLYSVINISNSHSLSIIANSSAQDISAVNEVKFLDRPFSSFPARLLPNSYESLCLTQIRYFTSISRNIGAHIYTSSLRKRNMNSQISVRQRVITGSHRSLFDAKSNAVEPFLQLRMQ